jgi:metal-responsive CopG/Arc/MetJ family transcriptional regulator
MPESRDHPRTHVRFLMSLLPEELEQLDAAVKDAYPAGRRNRSEFVRAAIAEAIARRKGVRRDDP